MTFDTSRGPATRTFGLSTSRLDDTHAQTGRVAGRRRGRRAWRRVRRTGQKWWRFITDSITPAGGFVICAMLLSIALGLTLHWVEAWFVAIGFAVLLLVGLPFLIGSRNYLIRIEVDRMRVMVGGTVNVHLDIENGNARPALPAAAELPIGDAIRRVPVPLIGPHGSVQLPLDVAAPRRGVIQIGPLTLARQDPLALVRREVTWRDRHLIHVHPRTVLLPPGSAGLVRDLEGTPRKRLTDSDLSFHAVREYVRGDAMRHVHWKSTAKTGNLMVRQYEESQTARAAILFDANRAEYANDDEFELGVSVAASLGLQAVREGRERYIASQWHPGKLRPSIDGLEEIPSQTVAQLLDNFAELQIADEPQPIELLARRLAESRRPLSVVSVVTGSLPDLNRLRRIAVTFPPDVIVLAIRCEWLAAPAAQLTDSLTMMTVGDVGDLPHLMVRGGLS